jgi:hypothetical protein
VAVEGSTATNQDQLRWEARWARPAAAAAILGALLAVVSQGLFQSIYEDRPGVRVRADQFLSFDEAPGTLLASAVVQAVSAVFLVGVFLYLFRATVHRDPRTPRWFVWLVVAAPLMYAAAQVLGAFEQIDIADRFAAGEPIRGEAGDERARDIASEETSPGVVAVGIAGSVGLAFLFVMLPVRARRAGLLSPFMMALGVIAGALLVLPLLPGVPVVIQAFWLGALAALFLGRWPGGRGPAWDSGEAEPWPTAAERRGLTSPGEREQPEAAEASPEEPAPVADRPASRKRKKKRR